MIKACTIAARNYIAHVRVLANSFFACHPDGRFAVLLIDDEPRTLDPSAENFECLWLADIGLDRAEINRLAAIYDVTELATAVKPPLLQHLLRRDGGHILYLDPDIRIYESLEELSRLAIEHGIVLTPHVTAPLPRDRRRIDEFQILASGIYNLGFIGVGAGSETFLDWWWTRTRREALSDPTRMMFTDQRWIDFVPGFYPHFILKDTSYNVAYWNLHGRPLTSDGQHYFIDGRPLRFFHFSGFDAKRPFLLSKHQGDQPRVLLSENPALHQICQEYAASLEEAGHSRESQWPYGWKAMPSGIPFNRRMRRLYRDGLGVHETGGGLEPPSPFDVDAAPSFMDWLEEPIPVGLNARVPRYFYSIYRDRIDLQSAFPDLAGEDRSRFLDWVRLYGAKDEGVPPQLLRTPPEPHQTPEPVPSLESAPATGVNIVGYFRADLGVGEAARLLTSAVEAVDIPHATVNYGVTLSRQGHAFSDRGAAGATYDINVLCVNADSTPGFARNAGPGFFQRRYTAGYWFWELEQFPPTQHAAFDYVDEVWTATHFVAGGIRAVGSKPVYTIPLPVPIPKTSPQVTRESLGLPPGFMFLFVFDFFSVLERKNPIGLIAAFERAFRPNEGPILVLKTINGDSKLNDLEQVRAAARGRPDILIIDTYYSAQEKNSLLGLCDCYVSLHRSEGLGLTMAEAMALQKPVIATGYSGNLDFMTPENSYLVDYVMGAVPAACHPYPEGTPWAEPNLDRAAEYMRRVVQSPREAATRAARARQDVLTRHDAKSAGIALARRLDQIRAKPRPTSVPAVLALRRVASAEAAPTMATPLTGLEEITSLVTPTPSVAPGTPFRRPLLAAQKLFFRFLRPYWWQQRNVHLSLIAALREAQMQILRMQVLETDLKRVEAQHDALLEHSVQLEQHQLRRFESVAAFQESASAHLKTLNDQLTMAADQVDELSKRLYAVPYTSAPDRFLQTNERGRQMLGFHSRREVNGHGDDVYAGFEDIFRGSEAFIRDRFRVYLPLLRKDERVVEIGCGRGELLDLLREAGVSALGVDIDEGMVRRCRAKGHEVEQLDALRFLRTQPDGSLPSIFASQVVEHLPYDDLMSFLKLSRVKLKPGGRLIFETVNPHALEAYKTFWTDLTHQRPIFPEVALAWCWLHGFDSGYVLFPHGSGDLERDRATQGEYAVVAGKS